MSTKRISTKGIERDTEGQPFIQCGAATSAVFVPDHFYIQVSRVGSKERDGTSGAFLHSIRIVKLCNVIVECES